MFHSRGIIFVIDFKMFNYTLDSRSQGEIICVIDFEMFNSSSPGEIISVINFKMFNSRFKKILF